MQMPFRKQSWLRWILPPELRHFSAKRKMDQTMKLPQREFYTLNEVAARWGVPWPIFPAGRPLANWT